jgi:hypothetical protein
MALFQALDFSTVIGGVVVALVLGFLRFGDGVIDLLVSYRSSPVDAVEQSMIDD